MKDLHKYYPITLALAGIFQAGKLIHQLAMTGNLDEAAFGVLIESVFKIDSPSALSVYGAEANLKIGLTELIMVFSKDKKNLNANVSRYALSLILLERQLSHNKTMLETIRKRIEQSFTQIRFFNLTHPTVIANLSDIYQSTISHLRLRINIIGKAEYVQKEEIMDKIRALLLAGIRSAVLWRQVGGRRWQLFLTRKKILHTAQAILKSSSL